MPELAGQVEDRLVPLPRGVRLLVQLVEAAPRPTARGPRRAGTRGLSTSIVIVSAVYVWSLMAWAPASAAAPDDRRAPCSRLPSWLPDISAMMNGGASGPTGMPPIVRDVVAGVSTGVLICRSVLRGSNPQHGCRGAVDVLGVTLDLLETISPVEPAHGLVGLEDLALEGRQPELVEGEALGLPLDLDPGGQQLAALLEAVVVEVVAPPRAAGLAVDVEVGDDAGRDVVPFVDPDLAGVVLARGSPVRRVLLVG